MTLLENFGYSLIWAELTKPVWLVSFMEWVGWRILDFEIWRRSWY